MPRNIGVTDITGIDEFYLAGKTLKIKQKVIDGYWLDNNKWKKVTLKAGKTSSKAASGYTGDYVVNVYKLTKNAAGVVTAKSLVTNFKKIADGDYKVVIKGVNNYYNAPEYDITVINGVPFAKQGFKFTKKNKWEDNLKLEKFNIKVTNKKAKAEIPVIKKSESDTKAGYYVKEIKDMYGYNIPYDGVLADEGLTQILRDAGKYNVTLRASNKLTKDTSIFGDKTIAIEVKGTKLKASNFLLDGKSKLNLEYDGEATKKPVEVTLKKALADSDKYIPMKNGALGNKNLYETFNGTGYDPNNQDDALNWYRTGNDKNAYKNSNAQIDNVDRNVPTEVRNGYADTGMQVYATQVNKNTWNFGYSPANQNMDTYYIYIYPTGPYYADGGCVRLSYTRAGFNLTKTDLVEFKAAPAEVNVNGTYTDIVMKSKHPLNGCGTVSSDKFYYEHSWVDGYGTTRIGPFAVKYSKNTKVGTATATITGYSKNDRKLYKGSKKATFTINPKKVTTIYDAASAGPNDLYAVVTDAVAPKNGKAPSPKVTVYQKSSHLNKSKAIKNKSDYVLLAPSLIKDNSYALSGNTTGAKSGNFKFVDDKGKDKTLRVGEFNVYGKKAKIDFSLSNDEAARWDGARKGYIYMSGNEIRPGVTSITIDGSTTTFNKAYNVSDNFIVSYKDNVKVGTMTVTVTLRKNTADKTLSGNATYPYGGSVSKKFKIVPHNNRGLILEK